VPSLTLVTKVPTATCKQIFSDAHTYNINSISPNSDCETFMSTDDLRINMWHLERSDQSFNIVDIKPDNLEDLTEVITSSAFHPKSCNILAYSSSRGRIRLNDLRERATADEPSRFFELPEDPNESEFAGVVSSISHMQFDPSGNHILCRDYLTLKLWDVRQESHPVQVIPIHGYLENKLGELYQNECIFDKFECAVSHNGHLVTGTYDDNFFIHNLDTSTGFTVKPTLSALRMQASGAGNLQPVPRELPIVPEELDFLKKALHVSFNPRADLFAVSSLNCLYTYVRIPR